jgi:hypothetical protein
MFKNPNVLTFEFTCFLALVLITLTYAAGGKRDVSLFEMILRISAFEDYFHDSRLKVRKKKL